MLHSSIYDTSVFTADISVDDIKSIIQASHTCMAVKWECITDHCCVSLIHANNTGGELFTDNKLHVIIISIKQTTTK